MGHGLLDFILPPAAPPAYCPSVPGLLNFRPPVQPASRPSRFNNLAQEVTPQEKQQWQESRVRMFDRGLLSQSDPIGFQASLVTPDSSIRPFEDGPSSATEGLMFPTNIPADKLTPQMQRTISQMGLTPNSVAGKIGFGTNTDQFTIEHELTHKGLHMIGIESMRPPGLPAIDQETVVRLHGVLRGQAQDIALLRQQYGNDGAAALIKNYGPELVRLQQKAAADNLAKMPWLGR